MPLNNPLASTNRPGRAARGFRVRLQPRGMLGVALRLGRGVGLRPFRQQGRVVFRLFSG